MKRVISIALISQYSATPHVKSVHRIFIPREISTSYMNQSPAIPTTAHHVRSCRFRFTSIEAIRCLESRLSRDLSNVAICRLLDREAFYRYLLCTYIRSVRRKGSGITFHN